MDYLNLLKSQISFNVNNYFFYFSSLIQSFVNSNETQTNKTMLGKKRNFENFRQTTFSDNNTEISTYSDSNKINNLAGSKITKDIFNLYNQERSICFSCVKTKNKKYQTNKFIPCIPFSISS